MKRHRLHITVVLVGWYLMAYAPGPHWDKPIGWKPPLSQWQIMGSYDTAQECKGDWNSYIDQLRNQKDRDAFYAESMMDAQCIASDDPRLKGEK